MDVTSKCSTAAVNKHAIGVNMLCGKAEPLSFTLTIPAQTESEPVHTEAYHAMQRPLRALSAVKTCNSCECCLPGIKTELCQTHTPDTATL